MVQPSSLQLLPARVDVTRHDDGRLLLRSPEPLGPYPDCISNYLEHWARERPDHVFLKARGSDGWETVTYAACRRRVDELAQLLAGLPGVDVTAVADGPLQLGPRPVMVLSDNSIAHALLMLAAMHVGIPVVPVSPAYSLMSKAFTKLKGIAKLCRPALVFAEHRERFAPALQAIADALAASGEPVPPMIASLAELKMHVQKPVGTEDVTRAAAAVGPDTIAKVLFTSGSTGTPKGVLNSQRMLCANQQAIAQCWPFLRRRPPLLVDWLPWNHTFGGNHNFNMVLAHGGTLVIDAGKPAPGLVATTVANLREHTPTMYFNVPRGFDMLLPYLEADDDLASTFFCELDLVFYAGAALPQSLWERLDAVARRVLGHGVMMSSAWGSTETAPLVTSVHFPIPRAGVIGLPAPGCELSMVPHRGKYEMRVSAPWVTPGYLGEPELTAHMFDEHGAYLTGDAGQLADPDCPERGVVFDGRVAEDFKLTSGTWVHVGTVRVDVIAALSPICQDVVVAGEGRDALAVLVVPNLPACQALLATEAPLAQLRTHPRVLAAISKGLAAHNQAHPQGSRRIARAMVVEQLPQIDAGEITDKGYLNQRAILERRSQAVARLYASSPGDDVVCMSPPA